MYSDNIYHEKRVASALKTGWQQLRRYNLGIIGLYGVSILILLCLIGPWIAPYTPGQQFLNQQLLPPSWSNYGNTAFFLGTDDLGRDMLTRLLNGVTPTFGSALIVTLSASVVGILLGTLAGITRGLRSAILNHIFDILLVIPSLLIAIIIVVFIGASLQNAMLAVWLAILPHIVHTVYRAIRDELGKEYVIASRLDGATNWTILWETIMPNITPSLVGEFTRVFSLAIFDISALGFLKLGARLPSTEWGAMMGDNLELLYVAPWTVILPGLSIMLSVLLVNLLGDGIQRTLLTEKA